MQTDYAFCMTKEKGAWVRRELDGKKIGCRSNLDC